MLAAGGDPILLGIARDDPDETRRLLAAALENDVVITSGGVSVGDYDFVKQVQDELGVERRFWGVATKPGKPLAFGMRGDTLVFGVPGNPVAAMVSFEMYVRPALLAMQGRPDVYRPWFFAASAEPVRRTKERTEARRCRLTPRRRRDPLHHDRPAGLRDPELDGRRRGTGLRPARVPRRRDRDGAAGHAARGHVVRAPAVPGGGDGGLSAAARRRRAPKAASPGGGQWLRVLAAASPSRASPTRSGGGGAVGRRAGREHEPVATVVQHADVGRDDGGLLATA